MKNFKIYIINGLLSSLIGMIIELVWAVINNAEIINIGNLLESMLKGTLIGTITLFVSLNVLLLFRNKPIISFIGSFIAIALLTTAVAIMDFIETSSMYLKDRWIFVFIISEILGLSLTAIWHRQIMRYNEILKKKKSLIPDSDL